MVQIKKNKPLYRRKALWLSSTGILLLLMLVYAGLAIYKAVTLTANSPSGIGPDTPASQGIPFQEIEFPSAATDKLTLRGWWIPSPGANKVIILVHGRGGNRLTYQELFRPLWEAGFSVLAFDLRGHGLSTNASSTWGYNEQWDLVGAVNYARSRGIPAGSIGVIGWSIGAASAIMALEDTNDIGAVVAESSYADTSPLLARNPLQPGLIMALRLVVGIDFDRINPANALTRLGTRSVLLIHDGLDNQIPLEQAQKLQQAAGNNGTFWLVPDTDHTGAIKAHYLEFTTRVVNFFKEKLGT